MSLHLHLHQPTRHHAITGGEANWRVSNYSEKLQLQLLRFPSHNRKKRKQNVLAA